MQTIIHLIQTTKNSIQENSSDIVKEHLLAKPLEEVLSVLLASDFLNCSLTLPLEEATMDRVTVTTWLTVFSVCHRVMGLARVHQFLLEFFLYNESAGENAKVLLGDDTPSHFIKSVINQRTYQIEEEIKHDLVLDWAARSSSANVEEKLECLNMIEFKCFEDVESLEQFKSDIRNVLFLRENNLSKCVLKVEDAIKFKQQRWDLSFSYTKDHFNMKNMRDLIYEKMRLPWPKLVGLFPNPGPGIAEKYILLNNQSLQVQGKLPKMVPLLETVNAECMLCYRSSVFFVSTADPKCPKLCQLNYDLNLTFHVLDLPETFRSINDEFNCRSSRFKICPVGQYLYIIAVDAFCPMTYDTPEKRNIFRLNLDLAIESCNQALAIENASSLRWEHFTDIPEEYLISSPNRLFNGESIKTVAVSKDLFILNDDICICFNVETKVWKEVELAPPARSNPVVFGSQTHLFILGGSCMGKHLVSGEI